jgi:hypothetical protein
MNKMLTLYTRLATIICFATLPPALKAQETPKPRYTLFKPTPTALLRDMETDRPGITESPFTVDAGHFQYETDLISYEKEKSESKDQTTFLINQFNLKIGITTSTALQVGLESFGIQREQELPGGQKTTSRGIGDITIRLKQNILGNDGGAFAISVLPYVKIPTAQYDPESRFEGGFMVPMQLELPKEWKLGMQLEGDRLKDKDLNAVHTEFLQSLSISHALIKDLEGMAETYYTFNFKDKHWANFLNAAMQFEAAKNLKLDAGLNYGLQHDAEKTYYLGMAVRF